MTKKEKRDNPLTTLLSAVLIPSIQKTHHHSVALSNVWIRISAKLIVQLLSCLTSETDAFAEHLSSQSVSSNDKTAQCGCLIATNENLSLVGVNMNVDFEPMEVLQEECNFRLDLKSNLESALLIIGPIIRHVANNLSHCALRVMYSVRIQPCSCNKPSKNQFSINSYICMEYSDLYTYYCILIYINMIKKELHCVRSPQTDHVCNDGNQVRIIS